MKKILMLGNHEIVIYNFRKELIKRMIDEGYEVYVSCPYGKSIEKLKELGCIFIETKVNRRNTNPFQDIKLLLNYLKMLEEINPSVVLSFTIKPNIYGGIACRLKHIPYICNVTGLGTGFFNGGIIKRIIKILMKLSYRKANKVFLQNVNDLNMLLDSKVVADNYELIPGSGVNLHENKLMQYPEENGVITFSFIGRIMKEKGIEEFLYAAKLIKMKYENVKFIIAGMIDQEDYKNILNEYNANGIIQYIGFKENLEEIFNVSWCIINPSYSEGMSNVLLEAAARGRPIIASNIPGCKEIIDEDKNGFLINVKSANDLIRCLEKFISIKYDEKKQMGIEGRAKVKYEFDREIVVEKYLVNINKLIERE